MIAGELFTRRRGDRGESDCSPGSRKFGRARPFRADEDQRSDSSDLIFRPESGISTRSGLTIRSSYLIFRPEDGTSTLSGLTIRPSDLIFRPEDRTSTRSGLMIRPSGLNFRPENGISMRS